MKQPLDHLLDIGLILALFVSSIASGCSQSYALDVSYIGNSISYHNSDTLDVAGTNDRVIANERHPGLGFIIDNHKGWGVMYYMTQNSYSESSTIVAIRKKHRFSLEHVSNGWFYESSVNIGTASGYGKADINEKFKFGSNIPFFSVNSTLVKQIVPGALEGFINMSILPGKTTAAVFNFGITFNNVQY